MAVTTNVWNPPEDSLVQFINVNFDNVEVRPTVYLNQEYDTARVFGFILNNDDGIYTIPINTEAVFHYVEYGTGRRVSVPAKGVNVDRDVLYIKINGDLIKKDGRGTSFIRINYQDKEYVGSIPGPDIVIRPIGTLSGNDYTLPDHIPLKALVVKEEGYK